MGDRRTVQLERIRGLVTQGVEEGARMWQPTWACPTEGYFYPPTLFTDVSPSSTIAQVEIFGPVLVSMTFRTPEESVALANNTPYGLAASVWTENINLALDIAPKLKSGVVWVNSTNLFDAAAGFGGYRESGFGREGGREGMYEYLTESVPADRPLSELPATLAPRATRTPATSQQPAIDRTPKLFIGKQARPDSGYSRRVLAPNAARSSARSARKPKRHPQCGRGPHALATRDGARRPIQSRANPLLHRREPCGPHVRVRESNPEHDRTRSAADATREVEAEVSRLFTYGAWGDKYDGAVHSVPIRGVAIAMNESIGVLGIACPNEFPLLGFISLVAPTMATGNTVIAVPSEPHPLSATDFYSILETSDVPAGVVNIITGGREALAKVLAEHDDVEGMWYFGSREGVKAVERASASNETHVGDWHDRDWLDPRHGEGQFASHTGENVWVPYGSSVAARRVRQRIVTASTRRRGRVSKAKRARCG